VQSSVYNTGTPVIAFAEVPDAVALLTWLPKDALIKRLDAEIDAEADDGAALSHEVRQRQEAEVLDDLLDVERNESALVREAQSQGLPAEHRNDCSPLAILGCRPITAPCGLPVAGIVTRNVVAAAMKIGSCYREQLPAPRGAGLFVGSRCPPMPPVNNRRREKPRVRGDRKRGA
jgi:hypothetical protein